MVTSSSKGTLQILNVSFKGIAPSVSAILSQKNSDGTSLLNKYILHYVLLILHYTIKKNTLHRLSKPMVKQCCALPRNDPLCFCPFPRNTTPFIFHKRVTILNGILQKVMLQYATPVQTSFRILFQESAASIHSVFETKTFSKYYCIYWVFYAKAMLHFLEGMPHHIQGMYHSVPWNIAKE